LTTVTSDAELSFLVAGGISIVLFAAWYFSQDQRARRALRKVPRTTVHNAVEGQAAVFGQARWENDPDPGANAGGGSYREPPRRLVIERSDAGPVLVSDHQSVLK
jgi:hypothetical protein